MEIILSIISSIITLIATIILFVQFRHTNIKIKSNDLTNEELVCMIKIKNIKTISAKLDTLKLFIDTEQKFSSIIEIYIRFILAYFLTRLFTIKTVGKELKNIDSSDEILTKRESFENIVNNHKNLIINSKYYIPWNNDTNVDEPLNVNDINENEAKSKEFMKNIMISALKVAKKIVFSGDFTNCCKNENIFENSESILIEKMKGVVSEIIVTKSLNNGEELKQKLIQMNNKENIPEFNFYVYYNEFDEDDNQIDEGYIVARDCYRLKTKSGKINMSARLVKNAMIDDTNGDSSEGYLFIDGTVEHDGIKDKYSFALCFDSIDDDNRYFTDLDCYVYLFFTEYVVRS